MGIFSTRDRIAIAIISVLIFAGWGVRFLMHQAETPDEVRVLRGVIPLPAELEAATDPSLEFPGIDAKVNINTAGQGELTSLPGIGPVKACAILEYRDAHGPFDSPDDLLNVTGIGPATLEGIGKMITVGADSTGY